MQLTSHDLAKRFSVSPSTITRWRQNGYLPEPSNPERRRGIVWDADDIEAWESLGQPNATTEIVEANLDALAADLDMVAACEQVHEALRQLAVTAATSLRLKDLPLQVRLSLGGVYVATDWFRNIENDTPPELHVLRANLNILRIVRDSEAGR